VLCRIASSSFETSFPLSFVSIPDLFMPRLRNCIFIPYILVPQEKCTTVSRSSKYNCFRTQLAENISLHSILPKSTIENSTNPSIPPGQQPQHRKYTRAELSAIFHAYNSDITLDEVYSMMAKGHYKETELGSDLYVIVSLEEFLNHYKIPRSREAN
jgi:hypothetical protein